MKYSSVPQLVGLLKAMLNLSHTVHIKGDNSTSVISQKYTFNIGLRLDAHEPFCFKPGIMLDMTKLYTIFQFQ